MKCSEPGSRAHKEGRGALLLPPSMVPLAQDSLGPTLLEERERCGWGLSSTLCSKA